IDTLTRIIEENVFPRSAFERLQKVTWISAVGDRRLSEAGFDWKKKGEKNPKHPHKFTCPPAPPLLPPAFLCKFGHDYK
uniref:Uncharacterized protein n=1 Tax=Gasterosteus aculeatus aculeatus TaxID=481459 RepID=A0AAQ4QDM4_GASAC